MRAEVGLLLAGIGLAALAAGCDDCRQSCTSAGGASVVLFAGIDATDATATVCKSVSCESCVLQTAADGTASCSMTSTLFSARVTAASAPSPEPSFDDSGAAVPAPIEVDLAVSAAADTLADGDAWSFTLVSPTNELLVSRTSKVTYQPLATCPDHCVSFQL